MAPVVVGLLLFSLSRTARADASRRKPKWGGRAAMQDHGTPRTAIHGDQAHGIAHPFTLMIFSPNPSRSLVLQQPDGVYPQAFSKTAHSLCGKHSRVEKPSPLAYPDLMTTPTQHDFSLAPEDNERLAELCGPFDEHLRQIELRLGVEIGSRGHVFRVIGEREAVIAAEKLLHRLFEQAGAPTPLDAAAVHLAIVESGAPARIAQAAEHAAQGAQDVIIKVKKGVVRGRGANQSRYLHAIATHDINFGIGPAGTGKTFLAVASAVEALNEGRVQRLILVRPAVEAGEKLGFLPGDLTQKVDPYLRPLYDALYEMLGTERVAKLLERSIIEIAPLAYMRGRTLNDAYVILDEAQNTTVEQMKMFLTRIGFGSTAIITGDLTQIDLPKSQKSGLRDAIEVLRSVEGISFTFFTANDVVRHPLVARIVRAYEACERDAALRQPQIQARQEQP